MKPFTPIQIATDLQDLQAAFLSKVNTVFADDTACWEWTGHRNRGGYGRVKFNGSMLFAHRVSYALFVGPIPTTMLCCHRCDNPACVNPNHLFLGTHQQNTHDMLSKGRHHEQKKTHCSNGHEYTEDNIYWSTRSSRSNPQRKCKICTRAVMNRLNARKRAAKEISE